MGLIILIYIIVVAVLVVVTLTQGLERALPFFLFAVLLLPMVAQIKIPDLFAITGQRVAVATLAGLYIFFKPVGRGASPLKTTPLKALLLLHIGWCVLSAANSIVPVDSFKKLSYEVVEYYLTYLIMIGTITKVRTIHRLMGAMVFAILVACVFGCVEAYSAWRVTSLFPYLKGRFGGGIDLYGDNRNYSTFAAPHLFGAAISFAIVEALYLLTLAKKTSRKVYLWFALLLMFLNIYKLVTRGPWLALIIGLAMLLFVGDRVTRKRITVLALLSVAVMLVRPGVYGSIEHLYVATVHIGNPEVNIKGDSFEYRFVLRRVAQHALDQSFTRALWGYGLESFYDLDLTAPFFNNPEYHFQSCDSSWIELMVETGYVGLIIIAVLLIKPAVLLFRGLRRLPKPESYLCGILLINMVQYYFMMTNVALYSWGQTAYMLWTWIAMAMVYQPLLARETAGSPAGISEPSLATFQPVGIPGF